MFLENNMKIKIIVDKKNFNKSNFAKIQLILGKTEKNFSLDIGVQPFLENICNINSEAALDFLFISSIIYCIDKIVPRKIFKDGWTRKLELVIPVGNINRWILVKSEFEEILSFLTGDVWQIDFEKLRTNLIKSNKKTIGQQTSLFEEKPKVVALFSGGIDSLVNAINWLETNKGKMLLVGHYDGAYSGVKSDQLKLISKLKQFYSDRINFIQSLVWQIPGGKENSLRSRSLLFISMGIFAASSITSNIPMIIPENGNISLNLPLTPSRIGSCSTRTVHPYFLEKVNKLLNNIEIKNLVYNPFEFKTKGELIENCKNQSLLKELVSYSVSCAKRGHKVHWKNRNAKQCGYCIPCIFRRAALNKIGLDIETYGRDICLGDVKLDSKEESSYDLSAVVDIIKKSLPTSEIEMLLMTNGTLSLQKLTNYTEVVKRAMEEVKELFKKKAILEIKKASGII